MARAILSGSGAWLRSIGCGPMPKPPIFAAGKAATISIGARSSTIFAAWASADRACAKRRLHLGSRKISTSPAMTSDSAADSRNALISASAWKSAEPAARICARCESSERNRLSITARSFGRSASSNSSCGRFLPPARRSTSTTRASCAATPSGKPARKVLSCSCFPGGSMGASIRPDRHSLRRGVSCKPLPGISRAPWQRGSGAKKHRYKNGSPRRGRRRYSRAGNRL